MNFSLEISPPVPTLQPGPNPLHRFLGFVPAQHILSMSARDPSDGREMPANGTNHVSVQTLHGVRKVRICPLFFSLYFSSLSLPLLAHTFRLAYIHSCLPTRHRLRANRYPIHHTPLLPKAVDEEHREVLCVGVRPSCIPGPVFPSPNLRGHSNGTSELKHIRPYGRLNKPPRSPSLFPESP